MPSFWWYLSVIVWESRRAACCSSHPAVPILVIIRLRVTMITGISSVDIGNYTCEVGGPQNTVLAYVTHQLYVRGTAGVQYYLVFNVVSVCATKAYVDSTNSVYYWTWVRCRGNRGACASAFTAWCIAPTPQKCLVLLNWNFRCDRLF